MKPLGGRNSPACESACLIHHSMVAGGFKTRPYENRIYGITLLVATIHRGGF